MGKPQKDLIADIDADEVEFLNRQASAVEDLSKTVKEELPVSEEDHEKRIMYTMRYISETVKSVNAARENLRTVPGRLVRFWASASAKQTIDAVSKNKRTLLSFWRWGLWL